MLNKMLAIFAVLQMEYYFVILIFIMIRTIELGRIKLNNCTVRESIAYVEKNLSDHHFMTLQEVSLHSLECAVEEPRVVEGITQTECCLLGDVELLHLDRGNKNMIQRRYEIENHIFFYELMKRLERNALRIFLLGQTKSDIAERVKFFLSRYPKLAIAGTGALGDTDDETLINNINSLAPDIIISLLPSPEQEVFLLEHRGKMSAFFWYGMGEINPAGKRDGFVKRIRKGRALKEIEKIVKKQGI